MRLAARIEGIGLVGPGLSSWREARDILAGRAPFMPRPTVMPSPEVLPPTERRRASKGVRLALAAGLEAVADSGRTAKDLVAVFSSSSGDGETCHSICEALASDDRLISPTRFHNSVHNAPAGYWGIATGAVHAAECVAAFDGSFGAGLLEAFARVAADPSQPVLLVSYDVPYPEPLASVRPIGDAFAVGIALASAQSAGRGVLVTLEIAAGEAPAGFEDDAIETIRRSIPAARALPLLAMLAAGRAGHACVDYLDGAVLHLEVAA